MILTCRRNFYYCWADYKYWNKIVQIESTDFSLLRCNAVNNKTKNLYFVFLILTSLARGWGHPALPILKKKIYIRWYDVLCKYIYIIYKNIILHTIGIYILNNEYTINFSIKMFAVYYAILYIFCKHTIYATWRKQVS